MIGLHHPNSFRPNLLSEKGNRFALRIEYARHREDDLDPQNCIFFVAAEKAEADEFRPDHLPERNVVDQEFRRSERVDVEGHHTLPGWISSPQPSEICRRKAPYGKFVNFASMQRNPNESRNNISEYTGLGEELSTGCIPWNLGIAAFRSVQIVAHKAQS